MFSNSSGVLEKLRFRDGLVWKENLTTEIRPRKTGKVFLTTLVSCSALDDSSNQHSAIFIFDSCSEWLSCLVYSHNLDIVVFQE